MTNTKNMGIALVGNPNSGKTTFFNALTGSNQHVGNWPGVTVDRKEGSFKHNDKKYNVTDLPGIYSLGAFSEDEVVARDFILTANPEVIINVIDANNIERNLYLTTQLLEMGKKVVIALNMVDEAEKKDIKCDIKRFSNNLDIPVIPTVASRGKGIDEVIETAVKLLDTELVVKTPFQYGEVINQHIENIHEMLKEVKLAYPPKWVALKVVEGDSEILIRLKESEISQNTLEGIMDFYKEYNDKNLEIEIIDSRYAFAHKVIKGAVKDRKRRS